MPFLRRHRAATVVSVVVALVAGILTALAVSDDGYQTRHVDLNDGGVWVTSAPELGLWGRLNKPAGSLDLALSPPGAAQSSYQLDIRQDGAAVAAWDEGAGALYPVDPATGKRIENQDVPVSSQEQVEMNGGTIAVLDPQTGRVWAQRVDTAGGIASLSGLDPSGKTLITLPKGGAAGATGQGAGLAVGLDGTVYAVDAAGHTATAHPDGDRFAKPSAGTLGHHLESVQVTALGSSMVVYDAVGGEVYQSGTRSARIAPDPDGRLQPPSDAGHGVIVATKTALVSVPTSGDDETTNLFTGGTGRPAAPTWLGPCVHAAWASAAPTQPGVYARACDGGAAKRIAVPNERALVHPEFRVNRGAIILNDLTLGRVFDVATLQEVDNWSAVKPPPVVRASKKNKNNTTSQATRDLPPKAADDDLGARPGRTTVLHVLDNDSDPSGAVLAVTRLTAADDPKVNIQIAPDGQSVEAALPDNQANDVHFKYTVDDGKLTASAAVTISVRSQDENGAPAPRARFTQRAFSVSAGGTLALPVLDDWRDPDGDPLVVTSAQASAGSVTVTPDGRLNFLAPATGGAQKLTYQVSDGRAAAQQRTIPITVLAPDSAKTAAPIAQPDIARGQVGQPIRVQPLGNDLPGADPTNPNASLALAGAIANPAGVKVSTDLKSGQVTIVASRHGTFVLNYTAAYGNARFGHSVIRVDVADTPATPQPPVAVPDTSVLYGQSAATVDVLANDFDPAGGVLVVQHAEAATDGADSQLQVAIVGGRFLRVSARESTLTPATQVVRYTITDGLTAPVTGELTVTQQPPPEPDTPLAVDDYATVRSGDSSLIPVLDNDIDPAGATLSLLDDVQGAPSSGRLAVASADDTKLADPGAAFVTGKQVRYVAPVVRRPIATTVSYVAQNPDGVRSTGTVHVTITPPPSKTNPNQQPTASPVDSRVISGDTIRITVPTTNVDPDGDTANVTGITSAPKLGRIVAIGATSITYEAFPTESGTDRFGYTISDAYGLTSSATISIGVGQASDPQPPVAVDDTPTAAPGAKLRVDVLANDVIAPDDSVSITDLHKTNPELPSGIKLVHQDGPVEVTAPSKDGADRVVQYAVNDGAGDPSVGTLTVHALKGYVPPPVAQDVPATPAPGAATVTVDVLAKASDPQRLPLRIAKVYTPGVTVSGGKLVIPVLGRVRNVVFAVANSQGGSAAAVVHVPARGVGAPYAKANTLIQVPRNGAKTVSISDYVLDPTSRAVRLTTTDHFAVAPAGDLTLTSPDPTHLTITGRHDYDGPAAITFQVTDGKTLNDPKGQLALITVQVQVGDPTPVVRCPTAPIDVVEGGQTRRLDITALCHVWLPDRAQLDKLTYTATWQTRPSDVDILGSGGHTIGLQAHGAARPGADGTITVRVPGTRADASTLNVTVRKLGPPSIRAITIDGFTAGHTATRDLRGYVSSPLADPDVTIVRVLRVSGPAAKATSQGSAVRITPNARVHGTVRYKVTVSDIADKKRTDRQVTGAITVHVLNVPDAPGAPQVGRTVLSRTVVLSWTTPAANGAQIDGYRVSWAGGSQQCPASPCRITGLTNGRAYTFRVQAHNAVGYSTASGSSPKAIPDKLPAAVTALSATDPQDHSLHIAWRPVNNGSSRVTSYQVHWSGGGSATATGGRTAITATGLDNHNVYTFTVVAVNQLGPGPATSVQGQSAGNPGTPTNVGVAYASEAGTTNRAVTVSWSAVDPNGAGSPRYTVKRNDGVTVCTNTTATRCADQPASAKTYSYSVQAVNQAGHRSGTGTSKPFVVAGRPDTITNLSVTYTNVNGQVQVRYTSPNTHGQQPRVEYSVSPGGSSGTWTPPSPGSADTRLISGLPYDADVTVTLTPANEQQRGQSSSAGAHTSGHPHAPTVNCSQTSSGVRFAWGGPAGYNNHPVSRWRISLDGGGASTTSSRSRDAGGQDGAYHTLSVAAVDNRGDVGPANSARCQDPPKPTPPSVTVTPGAWTNQVEGCTNVGCHEVHVVLQHFPANSRVSIHHDWEPSSGSGVGGYKTVTVNGSGYWSGGDEYYGGGSNPNPGGHGTVTVYVDSPSGVSPDSCTAYWHRESTRTCNG